MGKVVSIGRLAAFYVVFVPMEYIPSKPPHWACVIVSFLYLAKRLHVFNTPIVNIGIYGLTHLHSAEAELISVIPLNSSPKVQNKTMT